MGGLGIAIAFAVTAVPAFLIARSLQRSVHGGAVNALLARLMRYVGVVLLAGAVAMLWAGDDQTRVLAVALALALVVNGLAVAMFVAVLRGRGSKPRR